jgi:hypothetical protein
VTDTTEEETTTEEAPDPYQEEKERREAEAKAEAISRQQQAEKHPDEDTGQGVPLPVSDPLPALVSSSPVAREELTTETQREGQDLVETENGEGAEPEEEEYPSTVEPSS